MNHLSDLMIQQIIEDESQIDDVMREHLDKCDLCRQQLVLQKNLLGKLQKLEYDRPSMRFARNIIDLLDKRNQAEKSSIFWTRVLGWGIVSSMSMAIVMFAWWAFLLIQNTGINPNLDGHLVDYVVLVLTLVGVAWILHFFDRWLGRRKTFKNSLP